MVIVHELYFVVKDKEVEGLREFPRTAYPELEEAERALDNRKGYSVKSYYYVWKIIQDNIVYYATN